MTTALMPEGRQRYFNNDGTVAAGCSLYTYAAGTLVPKVAYKDSAATQPHTNPIILDAKGEAVIYWDGAYKVDLKAVDATQITGYPVDDVNTDPANVWTLAARLLAVAGAGLVGFSNGAVYAANTVGKAIQNFALSGGAALIGYISSLAGSLLRTLQSVLREDIRLLDFIPEAQHAAIWTHTSAYDASDAIIAALAAANTIPGGARVLASRGKFLCTKPIPIPANVVLEGRSKKATIFSFSNLGDGFTSTSPINSSTAVNVGIEKCSIVNTNVANTGGAFVDVGGSYLYLHRVFIQGFKFGVIFDQSEHATVYLCEIITPAGGSGIWLVNGADHTPGANKLFTNRIEITHNQFNADAAALHNILDDGGACHTIRDNNFNAGIIAVRAANVFALTLQANESEAHSSSDFYICDTTLAGAFVGPCVGFIISGNEAISPATYNVGMQNGMNGRITNNVFGQSASCINFLNGAANQSTGNLIENNHKLVTGAGKTVGPFISGFSRSLRQNTIRQTATTYAALASAAGAVVITPGSMEFITVGGRLHLMNDDGTNGEDVIVTATTGATFTATLASVKAANFHVYGSTPADQEEGIWTPVLRGITTPGVHTYSVQTGQYFRNGNEVFVKGSIAISAKDAAMAGAMEISGLPFASESVTNAFAVAYLGLFGGFTFAAGYSQLGGLISAGGSTIGLRKSGSAVGLTTVAATDCPGATIDLYFEARYLTKAD